MFRRVEPVSASVWVEMVTGKKLMFQGNNSHLRALFRRYDANQNGQMSSKELCDALFSSEGRPTWLRGKIREVLILRSGGINSLKTLGRQFRFMDKSGNGTVDREELERAMNIMLRGCRLNLGPSDMKMVFDIFDHDKDGRVSYNEFIRGIRGKMNDRRVNIVKQAFQCFDTDRSGHVTLEECATMYDVSRHPKVQSGQWSEQKAMLEFMKQWDKDNSGTVTEAEFLE
jgi:Ca2+-binding EF-hand superfamily protein